MRTVSYTVPSFVLLVSTLPAVAQHAHEVSEDGLQSVALTGEPGQGVGASLRGGTPLFSTEADWSYDERRQVGALQVADMNNDGYPDVVVGCYISNSFPPYEVWDNLIFYNTGSGLEATPGWTSDDSISTTDIQIADFNGDGYPDIYSAGGSLSSASVIYYGSASGPSTTPGWHSNEPGGAFTVGAVALDIDNDGDTDLVTGNQGLSPDPYRPMFMFRNTGSGLETTPSWQSAEQSIQGALAAGDYDGDGFTDVAVSKWVNFETAIYRNLSGTLDTVPAWTLGDVLPAADADDSDRGVGFADFDADGNLDLAVGRDPSQMFTGDGAGNFALAWTLGDDFFGPPQDFRVVDVDNDSDADIAEVYFSTGVSNVYLNTDGSISTLPDWTYNASEVGTAIAFGDINADGRTDVVVGYSGNTCIRVFYGIVPPCPADIDNTGYLNNADINLFVNAFIAQDAAADFNSDGNWNNTDINLFIASFTAGCG